MEYMTNKVKLTPPTSRLSTTGARRRSGLIAFTSYYMPRDDGVPRTYRNETQLPEQKLRSSRHSNDLHDLCAGTVCCFVKK
jgi:hypothetical protein